ncbi:MAG: hypothetical protein CSA29_05810 [Desulfobacterales bacterium]|nr:MAG: hypothetical protein CSA29_05810 [Desulfobacterales bacterium]
MSSGMLIVDIGRDQVACILMTYGIKEIKVEYLSSDPREDDLKEGEFSDCRSVLSSVKTHIGDRFDKCFISIPANQFSFRCLELPFKGAQKINQILGHELEKYLPVEAGSFDATFSLLAKNTPKKVKGTRIAAAGLDHLKFEAITSMADALDLLPDVLTPGSGYSSAQIFARCSETPGLMCFLYMETELASIHVMRNKEIIHSRTVLINPDDSVPDMAHHLTQTYYWINDQFDCEDPLSLIVLSGNGSTEASLCEQLSRSLGVPVQPFDLFACVNKKWTTGVGLGAFSVRDCNGQCQNALAMGINEMQGATGYNFSRRDSGLTRFFQAHGTRLVVSLALFVVLILSFSLYSVATISVMEKEINRLNTDINQVFSSVFPGVKTIVDPVAQMQVKLDALQQERNAGDMGQHLLNIDILNEISRTLPASLDIQLNRFVRNKNNLRITGNADQFNTIDKMKHAFESRFADVDINSASMDKKVNRVKFSVTISLGNKARFQ